MLKLELEVYNQKIDIPPFANAKDGDKVIVIIKESNLEAEDEKSKRRVMKKKKFDVNSLSYQKSQELLKDYKGNWSDDIIKERRSYI